MTDPIEAAIEAAARAMHARDCGCADEATHVIPDPYYVDLARAAAPILIQAGREEAATDIEQTWPESRKYPPSTIVYFARLARGDNNE